MDGGIKTNSFSKGTSRQLNHSRREVKGTNSRWRDTLTPTEVAAYEAKALAELGPECAKWLAQGAGK